MMEATPLSHQIARALLRIEAVIVSSEAPFTYASGMRSPMYCDNRLALSYPDVRELITDAFVLKIRALDPNLDAIAAVATAGIPHAAWVAHRLHLPMAYVRPKAKAHGRLNQIEGQLRTGQRTIILEDLVTSGRSSLRAVEAVHAATGVVPEAVMCIFTYDRPGVREQFAAAGAPLVALCNLDTLLHVAQVQSLLDASELAVLRQFQREPLAWSTQQAGTGV